MAAYPYIFRRTVTVEEFICFDVQADSPEDARIKADAWAVTFNSDCPDGVQESGNFSCGDWTAEADQ